MIYILDFRDRSVGGAVTSGLLSRWEGGTTDATGLEAEGLLLGEPRVTFLLHGYNVDRGSGTVALTRLAQLLAPTPGALVATLWPGDSPLGVISYPFEGHAADDSAARLALFIERVGLQAPISFVTHSLGARFALGTMNELAARGTPVDQVCLMAPAVDDFSLADSDEFRPGVENAKRVGILHSTEDNVLKWSYPAGDWLQAFLFFWRDEVGFALGYRGPAAARRERVPSPITHLAVSDFDVDHGDYLPASDPAEELNEKERSAAAYARSILSGNTPVYEDVPT